MAGGLVEAFGLNSDWSHTVSRFKGQPTGSYVAPFGLTDQVARLVSFEVIAPYPIRVVVTRGEEVALQTYYARRSLILVVTACLTALVLLFTWRLARSQRVLRAERGDP